MAHEQLAEYGVKEEEKISVASYKDAHEIGKFFWYLLQNIGLRAVEIKSNGGNNVHSNKGYNDFGITDVKTKHADGTELVDYFSQTYDGLDVQYYIRLGYFLEFIEKIIIQNVDYNPALKLLQIDYEIPANIIYILESTISSHPEVCMMRRSYINVGIADIQKTTIPSAENFAVQFPNQKTDATYGQVMNVYFNMFWILQSIDALKDAQTGKFSLYGLLDALCQGYNQSTGNFNKLEVVIDTETNTIKIVDEVALPDRDVILQYYDLTPSEETALFDTYGYYLASSTNPRYSENTSHASFIRDLSFNTSVTPNLATLITVGSTNQGYVKGEDATALSRMNRGLTDRYKKQITDTNQTQVQTTPLPTPEQVYAAAIVNFDLYISRIGMSTTGNLNYVQLPKYDKNIVSNFQSTQTQLYEYYQAEATVNAAEADKTAASPNTGFLPFDLSLTMDGLSGMKVYQTFNIDSEFLPTNYPGTLLFLIKGITHKIENNQWTTTIDSMCVAKNPFAANNEDNPVDEASRTSNRGFVSAALSGLNAANISTLSTTNTSNRGLFNVNPTYKSPSKRSIIDKYGWPIKITKIGNNYYGTVTSLNSNRNVYLKDENYIRNNIVNFEFRSKRNPSIVLKFKLHKATVPPIQRVLTQIDDAGLISYAKNIQASILTRDTTNSPGNLSGHAFGLAIDVNPDKFPYGSGGFTAYNNAISNPASPNYNYARVVKIFKDSGFFYWGGDYNRTKDAHHFSLRPYNI